MRLVAGCLSFAFLVWLGAFHVEPLQRLDQELLQLAVAADEADPPTEWLTDGLGSLLRALPYTAMCLAIVAVAWRLAGRRAALAGVVAIAGANLTTQLLKPVLGVARPHEQPDTPQIDAASWPSGHVTGTVVALSVLLLVAPPPDRRRIAAVGAGLTMLMAFSVVANGWHYPSDALGGVAVAGAWVAAAAPYLSSRRPAATAAPRRRWRRATG